jgi:hypothetical protein
MGAFHTERLATLVQQCINKGLVAVSEVGAAYNLLCELVQLEDELEEAVGNKDEQALTTAIARAATEPFKEYVTCVSFVCDWRGNSNFPPHDGVCMLLQQSWLSECQRAHNAGTRANCSSAPRMWLRRCEPLPRRH